MESSKSDNFNFEIQDEVKKIKHQAELEVQTQTEKVKQGMKGRQILKAMLSKTEDLENLNSSSETDLSLDESIGSKYTDSNPMTTIK